MNIFKPNRVAYAHCDLPCGVYDPVQARLEAESVLNASKKYQDSNDENFRQRCITIKEERAEEVKHHLWVLWTDYFKPEHIEEHPNLHDLFWQATKKAGEAKKTEDPSVGEELIKLIDEIDKVFKATKS
jgi:nickel superoxide dismutase